MTKLIINWPLQIIAGLLSAAVESHDPMALAPHILADDPLGGVAGTSPQECYSFFQLHPAQNQIIRCVFRRRGCWSMIIIFCHCHIQRMVHCLVSKSRLICSDPQEKNLPIFLWACAFRSVIQSITKKPSNTWDFQKSHQISDTECTSLVKFTDWRNTPGSLNDGFAVFS